MPPDSLSWHVVQTDGGCAILEENRITCSPVCPLGQQCVAKDTCEDATRDVDVGTVTLTGLAEPLEVEPTQNTYWTTLSTFPPFSEGDEIHLNASGTESFAPFSLSGRGIAPLTLPSDAIDLKLKSGQALTIEWTPPTRPASTRVSLELWSTDHLPPGLVTHKVECLVPDTGTKTISAALVRAFADRGIGAFARLVAVRQTMDSGTTTTGCVEFSVLSMVDVLLSVDGLTPCVDYEQNCPPGTTCVPTTSFPGSVCQP